MTHASDRRRRGVGGERLPSVEIRNPIDGCIRSIGLLRGFHVSSAGESEDDQAE
mgnify:CR=1 FL=1